MSKALSKNRAAAELPAPPVAPSPKEAAAIAQARPRLAKRRRRVEVAVGQAENGTPSIEPPHADGSGWTAQQLNAFGTTSNGFLQSELTQLINAVCPGPVEEARINAALAVIDGIQPENEVEAMLACQMAATHVLTMTMMSRALRSNLIPQMEANGNLAVKLSRTFVAQTEALARLRRPAEQRVVVEHVHVHAGGQAVVGNVTHTPGGGASIENGHQAHATEIARTLALGAGSPVWSEDPEREALPASGGRGEMSMPDARRR